MTKPTTRNLALGLALAATAIAGSAYAEQTGRAKRDADGSGIITRAEVQTRSAALFDRLDANKDGKLDQADREARRNALFDRIDTDKNGQISRAEFGTRPQRPEGSGAAGLDGAEGLRDGGKHHGWGGHGRGGDRGGDHGGWGHHGGGIGKLADADKDGAISQAEFTAAALRRFDAADANKDGQVTREERQAARQAWRDEWRAKRETAAPTTPAS